VFVYLFFIMPLFALLATSTTYVGAQPVTNNNNAAMTVNPSFVANNEHDKNLRQHSQQKHTHDENIQVEVLLGLRRNHYLRNLSDDTQCDKKKCDHDSECRYFDGDGDGDGDGPGEGEPAIFACNYCNYGACTKDQNGADSPPSP
jgi:hypothetical protein